MKKKLGYIFIGLGIVVVLGYLIFSIMSFSYIDNDVICKKVLINIENRDKIRFITQKEILTILENHELNPIGKSYDKIRLESMEHLLAKNPNIKDVQCYKTPDGSIFVDVKQRTPKFLIAGFECVYVDADKKFIPASLNYAAYVPVVSGIVTKSMATGQLFDFVSYLEQNDFWNAQIEQIYVRPDKKIELITRVGDAVIFLGTLDNYQQKLDKLYKLYKHGFNVMGWNRYQKIDLQYDKQIVCLKTGAVEFKPEIVKDSLQLAKADSITQVKTL
jgi:cell division protein FtsQ